MSNVDVIVPAYNAAATIASTLRSIVAQTEAPGNIVVVNDGSTDQTEDAARQFASVSVVNQRNGGQGSARQLGTAKSSAEFLLFIDADDQLRPDALRQLRNELVECPSAVLAYGRAVIVLSEPEVPTDLSLVVEDASGDVWERLVASNFIRTPGCVLMRRSALIAVGGWDPSPSLKGNEDWDLWLRLAEIGHFRRLAEPVLDYCVYSTGYARNRRNMVRSQLETLRKHSARRSLPAARSSWMMRQYRMTCKDRAEQMWSEAAQAARSGDWYAAGSWGKEALLTWPRSFKWPVRCLIRGCR